MALVVKDRVKQTTTTTGTGNIVLNGNIDGFQTFAAALANGDTTYYGIFVPSTNDYEVGLGTWTEGSATLARTTVLESSNSGSAINITAQAEVFITQPAEKAVFQDANGDVDLGGNKILFGNLYSSTGDLPSASTYHGMFAHVHGTGKAYYAHGGNWVELVNEDSSGNVSMGGNLTVTGDLTVNGTTSTVNTTNTVVKDSLIELGNGTSGSPSNDAGIVIERGSSDNAFIGYDESADKFTVGTGSFTGATTGNLTISTGTLVANVEGNITGNVTGNVSGSSGSTTGNAATATALANARNIGGVAFDGTAAINLPGVNTSGNQDTSGNAATATILATSRNIGGVAFNGSASINLPGVNTAGNQDTSGNAATATTAGTVTTAAQPNITSLGTLTTLTVDDITINGSTISDAGDFTLDVEGKISLDANDGGYVRLKDDGTQYGLFYKSGDDFMIYSSVSDGDMKFTGNDGGNFFTALTLDMSAAGAATFNTSVTTPYLYVGTGSNDGTFYSDQAGRTAFANGQFYIQSSVSAFYNYASATYHGDSSGDAQYFRGNTLTGDSWSLTGAGAASFASVNINGNLNAVDNIYLADKIYHEGDTDTYLQFGTNAAYLYTGGSYVEFTSSGINITDGSLAEDYDALSGTTPTCDVDTAGAFSLTMSGNTTFTFSGAASGYIQAFVLQLTGNGSTVTWPGSVKWAGGTAPDAPASGETDILVFHTRDGGTNWYGVLASDAAS